MTLIDLIRRGTPSSQRGTQVLRALALALSISALTACGSSTSSQTHGAPASTAASTSGAPASNGTANGPSVLTTPVEVAHTKLGAVGYRMLGSGPPLVLVNGLGATMEDWYPAFVDDLARIRRVIVFDNAGIGKTQALPAPLTIGKMADQTSALIVRLGLHSPDVLGWSMGGMIAQALAAQHRGQVRRLVLCATQAGTGRAIAPPLAAARSVLSGSPAAVLAALFPAGQGAAERAYVTGSLSYPQRTVAPRATTLSQSRAIGGWLRGAEPAGMGIAHAGVPALVADGTLDALDPLANAHQLAALIPHSQLVVYPGAGHAFLFQDQATFVPRLESFLR